MKSLPLMFALCVPATVFAQTDVASPVKQFVEDFNRGDSKAAFALYSKGSVSIIDEFAPNIWQGPKALQMWAADYDKHAAATGVTEGKVEVGAATRIEKTATSAYVVMPAVYLYKEHGKPVREEAQIASVLHKEGGVWKIVSWTWTGVVPHPGK
jgi:hypothetical protein